MTKKSILKHKIIRAYHNPENWKYSEYKGYPQNTYFGFKNLKALMKSTIKGYVDFYGPTLRKWHYN